MKSLILSLFLMVACLSVTPIEAEAGPIRRAIAWKRDHRPVARFFANHQPVRRVIRWKREHTPVRNFPFGFNVDHEDLPV